MAKRFAYRTAIAGLTTLALTTSAIAAPQNFAFADPDDPPAIDAPANAVEANTPQPAENVRVAVGGTAPAAKDLIANVADLPAGTTFEVIPAIDTTKPGYKTANVFVKYPDGSRELITVPVTVGNDTEANAPQPKENVKVTVGADAPAAEDLIANAADLPAGTTFEVIPAINTNEPGTKNANVFVKYPDGSRELVEVPVTVGNNSEANTPQPAENVRVAIGATAPEAQNLVSNAANLPAGTTFEVIPAIDTTKPGYKTANVFVKYPDGTRELITVPVTVGNDAEANSPEAKNDVKVAFGAAAPAAKDLIANAAALPAGTTFEVTAIDTAKSGNQTVNVTVKYPDGTEESVPVQVKVEDAKAQNKSLIIDGAVGIALSLGTLLLTQFQIPGLKKANTKIQQKLGIFNPQTAATAEKAVGVIGGLAGLTGMVLSIITLADGLQGKGVYGKIDPKTGKQDEVRSFEWPKNASSTKPAQPKKPEASSDKNNGTKPEGSADKPDNADLKAKFDEFGQKVKAFFTGIFKKQDNANA